MREPHSKELAMSNAFAAFVRALDSCGFAVTSATPGLTVLVRVASGEPHVNVTCPGITDWRAPYTVQDLPLTQVASMPTCPTCGRAGKDLRRTQRLSPLAAAAATLVAADKAVRSALRHADDPGKSKVSGRTGDLDCALRDAAGSVEEIRTGRFGDLLADDCERLDVRIEQARESLAATRTSDRWKMQVLDKVADCLLPARLRGRVTLEDTPTLVALTSTAPFARDVNDLIEAFTVARNDGAVVLHCPRYAVDLLNRSFIPGEIGRATIMTVPVPGVPDEVVHATAQLWEPTGSGPLVDLKTAFDAARLTCG